MAPLFVLSFALAFFVLQCTNWPFSKPFRVFALWVLSLRKCNAVWSVHGVEFTATEAFRAMRQIGHSQPLRRTRSRVLALLFFFFFSRKPLGNWDPSNTRFSRTLPTSFSRLSPIGANSRQASRIGSNRRSRRYPPLVMDRIDSAAWRTRALGTDKDIPSKQRPSTLQAAAKAGLVRGQSSQGRRRSPRRRVR